MDDDYTYSRSKRLSSEQTVSTPSTAPPMDTNPAAELLQDMIREKRAKSQRTKKTYDPIARLASGDTSDHKETQSSPVTSLSSRGRPSMVARRTSGTTTTAKPTVQKEMGLREMSEHISKVDKQNFDLKLEVFHRRQRNDILEAKVEKLEAYEADYEDLQAKYTALLLESDRQRLVLDDAVAQICELQSENEELQAALGGRFAGIDDDEAGRKAAKPVSLTNEIPVMPATPPSPNRKASRSVMENHSNLTKSATSSAPRRDMMERPAPGRGAQKDASSQSLYSSSDSLNQTNSSLISVNQSGSVFSGDDEEASFDRQMLHSPRLSVLSESGFSSIYGSPHDKSQPATRADEDSSSPSPSGGERSPPRHSAQRDARIDLWMQDKPTVPKSSKRPPKPKTNQQYTSIEEVLSKRPVRPGEEVNVPHVQIPPRQSSSAERAHESQRRRERKSPPKSPSQPQRSYSSSDGSMVFGGKMPPTPDTMSTTTIGGPSSSTQSIIAEKSLLDFSRPPSKGYANLFNYARPRTSDSDSLHHIHNSSNHPNGLTFYEGLGLKRPNETEDVRPIATAKHGYDQSVMSPSVGGSAGLDQPRAAEGYTRPLLPSYQTDMMFNGDGFALVQPSRTFSYPSPRRRPGISSNRQASDSPTKDRKGFDASELDAPSISPDNVEDAKEAHMTRTKDHPVKDKSFYIKGQYSREANSLSTSVNQQYGEASHSRFGRFPFFKRSNSQNAGNKSNMQAISPRRPQTMRSRSSTRAQPYPLKPRVSNDARPGTSDGPTPTTVPQPSQSSNSRRHSAILDHAASFLPGVTASKDHHRRLSESRQMLQNEDSASKWPLGRTTSAKIKEGLGLMRSQAS